MIGQVVAPNSWTELPGLGIAVKHLGPGTLGALIVDGVAVLAGGHWYVRPAAPCADSVGMCVCELPRAHGDDHRCECSARWRDPVHTEPTEVHTTTMRM